MPTNDNSISATLVLDTSASMTFNGYVDITVIDSKAFVNCGEPGDKLAICNYDSSGHTPFPIAEVSETNNVLIDATTAIQDLSFNGPSTNIAAGLQQGIDQLSSETNSRGLVLLSDGQNNAGPSPLNIPPPSYPVFACAMGPASDASLMQQIAANSTNGQYYYAPKVVDMMKIYNQIRTLNPQTKGIANELNSITPQNYQLVPATVSQGNSEAQFVVAWTDTALTYTSGNPTSTRLSITLVDPNLNTTSYVPTYIGSGYVIFNVPSPIVGTWQVQVLYGSASESLPVTVGVFEFQHDPVQAISLNVDVPKSIKKGEPLKFNAYVTHGNEKVSNVSISAEITRPKISLENALVKYKDDYSTMTLSKEEKDSMPKDIAKLSKLHRSRLAEIDILSHITTVHHLEKSNNDVRSLSFDQTDEQGSYNVHVKVKGTSHVNGTPFERNQLISVLVQ